MNTFNQKYALLRHSGPLALAQLNTEVTNANYVSYATQNIESTIFGLMPTAFLQKSRNKNDR
jgi:hypothetical protein